tara:strand:+ start:719 stop:1465 length:747 start_codon:yes stop_codon:yes gene_type:complete
MFVPSLWVDGMAFGRTILRGGENPWAKPEELGLFHRELASLLSLDVVEISIGAAIDALLEYSSDGPDGDDVEAIEDFLNGPALSAYVTRGIDVLLGGAGGGLIAISLPGPGMIARRFMGAASVDENTLDDLSMALTGLVRAIYRQGIGFIRITEVEPRALEFMTPLTNVAGHYQCEPVLVLRDEAKSADAPPGFATVFREGDGEILQPSWWHAADEVPQGKKLFAELPDDMEPEAVLRRYAALKAAYT